MNPQNFDGTNRVMTAPDGMPNCVDLHVRTWDHPTLGRVTESHWQPTKDELLLLREGAGVRLYVCGDGMPPVALTVGLPSASLEQVNPTSRGWVLPSRLWIGARAGDEGDWVVCRHDAIDSDPPEHRILLHRMGTDGLLSENKRTVNSIELMSRYKIARLDRSTGRLEAVQ